MYARKLPKAAENAAGCNKFSLEDEYLSNYFLAGIFYIYPLAIKAPNNTFCYIILEAVIQSEVE